MGSTVVQIGIISMLSFVGWRREGEGGHICGVKENTNIVKEFVLGLIMTHMNSGIGWISVKALNLHLTSLLPLILFPFLFSLF